MGRRNRVEADPLSTFDSKTLRPYTAAVIEPFSKQFMRDLPALYAECRSRLPGALARKFDRTALGFEEVPGDGFESLADIEEIDIETDSYAGLLGALSDVVNSADITAWALSPQGEVLSAYSALELANSEHSQFRRRSIETRLWWRIGAVIARPERVIALTVAGAPAPAKAAKTPAKG